LSSKAPVEGMQLDGARVFANFQFDSISGLGCGMDHLDLNLH
jgi:hypothetical protein